MDQPLLEDSIATILNDVYDNITEYVYKDPLKLPITTGSILIYNKHPIIGRAFVHAFLKAQNNRKSIYMHNAQYNESSYKYSDVHFEFVISNDSIEFIKQTVRNKPISGKPFMFVLLSVQEASRCNQQALRRIIDNSPSSIFIMCTTSMTHMDVGLVSRCCVINLYKMKKDIVDCKETMMDSSIQTFLAKAKKLKPLDAIKESRDLAHKLFHVNCPFGRICMNIIKYFENDENLIHKVVQMCSNYDTKCRALHKDILLYEQVLFESATVYAPLCSTLPVKRKIVKKKTDKPSISLNPNNNNDATTKSDTIDVQPADVKKKKITIKLKKLAIQD